MPIIKQNQLDSYINHQETHKLAQVHLIYGDDYIVKQSLEKIIHYILPKAESSFVVETFDENRNNLLKAVHNLKTFSLLEDGKIIIIKNLNLLDPNKYKKQTEKNTDKPYKTGKMKKISKPLCDLLNNSNLPSKEVNTGKALNSITIDDQLLAIEKKIKLNNKKIPISKRENDSQLIENTIQNGFPEKHYLILLSNNVDKRQHLFKIIEKQGVIIDCFIPKSIKQSDRIIKDSLLRKVVSEIIYKNNKTIEEKAYNLIINMIGFDLTACSNNLNKLIDYVGTRKDITIEDVKKIFERTKKDPIFDFTNAITRQNLVGSLFYLNSLLINNVHPLQILTALTNNTRKLIVAKNFILNDKNKTWHSGQTFQEFKLETIGAVKKYDMYIEKTLEQCISLLKSPQKNLLDKYDNSLFLLRNKNPYSVYLTIIEADKLEENLLLKTVIKIGEAELKLKSTTHNSKIILESIVLFICHPSATNNISHD